MKKSGQGSKKEEIIFSFLLAQQQKLPSTKGTFQIWRDLSPSLRTDIKTLKPSCQCQYTVKEIVPSKVDKLHNRIITSKATISQPNVMTKVDTTPPNKTPPKKLIQLQQPEMMPKPKK